MVVNKVTQQDRANAANKAIPTKAQVARWKRLDRIVDKMGFRSTYSADEAARYVKKMGGRDAVLARSVVLRLSGQNIVEIAKHLDSFPSDVLRMLCVEATEATLVEKTKKRAVR